MDFLNKVKPMGTISRTVTFGLCLIGMWPGAPFSVVCRLFWGTTMLSCLVLQYKYFIVHFRTDELSDLIDSLSTLLTYSLFFFKLVIVWIKRGVFQEIIKSMDKDLQTHVNVVSNPMTNIAYIAHRFSNIIISFHGMAVLLYTIGAIIALAQGDENDTTSRHIILKVDLPFETYKSPIYEILMAAFFFHPLCAACLSGVLNVLPVITVLHIGCEIDIMCRKLNAISSQNHEELSNLVARHQEIILCTENIEKLFTYVALVQFTCNILIICCLGFLIMISLGMEDGTPTLLKCVFFYVVIATEAFLLCFSGEYLSSKGRLIGEAAYGSHWYDLDPSRSRTIILLVMRSQKDLTITVGKFMSLSLESFTTIVKASASYASVLLAMY